jgi:hypothetical protein
VDNHLASQTVGILTLFVRVVPVGASWVRDKCVGERASRLNGALSNSARTVVFLRSRLPYAVEMESRCLIGEAVVNRYLNGVTFIAFNGRDRPLPIDTNDLSFEAIRRSLTWVSIIT